MRILSGFLLASTLAVSACAQEKAEASLQDQQPEIMKEAQIATVDELLEKVREDKSENDDERKMREAMTDEERKAYDAEGQKLTDEYHELLRRKDDIWTDKNSENESQLKILPLSCDGVFKQGGAAICKSVPFARMSVGRSDDDKFYGIADKDGIYIVGFDRNEIIVIIGAEHPKTGLSAIPQFYSLKPRTYDTSRIDGLPPSQVSTFSDAQLKRIRSSSARKKVGFGSRATEMGFADGFIYPVASYTKTTNFGAQRILNGEPKKPHYGVDLAAPVGTPIVAPADGIVSLADDDLYFEGAMVLLDHGQGLISMYLHTDEILVEPGQHVKQGEQIATVGSKGRSTGPHLCWRLKWRNRNLDPELLTEWPRNARPE